MTNQEATALLNRIRERLADPTGRVMVMTHLKATVYDARHADWFTVAGRDLYVRHGRGKVCISYCGFKFGTMTQG